MRPLFKMHLKPKISPVYVKARNLPPAQGDRYAVEINKKMTAFYDRLDFSKWATTHGDRVSRFGN